MQEILEIIAKAIQEKRACIECLQNERAEALNHAVESQGKISAETEALNRLEKDYEEIGHRYGNRSDSEERSYPSPGKTPKRDY